jgi:ferric-dicitrate binding protein FerR (iron transport regulator)
MSEHDALDDLLRHAQPRPVPAPEDMEASKAAVRKEWHAVTARRNVRRRSAQVAIAATVVLGAFIAVSSLQAPTGDPAIVATIVNSHGPIHVLGDDVERIPMEDFDNVMLGHTIVTGDNAGLALAWASGGSVRIDARTRVRFDSDESVYVEEGRVYFDSISSLAAGIDAGGAPGFSMRTAYGELQHIGTQYMAQVDRDTLIVSVREGRVAVNGRLYEQTIAAGQQGTWAGQQRPSVLSISRSGPAWEWLARTTPPVEVDGKSLHEFLTWVCREMGLELRFEGQAERIAHEAILKGRIDTIPAEALRLRLATAALEWRIEGDVIYISND